MRYLALVFIGGLLAAQVCDPPETPPPATSRVVVYPTGTAGLFNVTDYGATGDGTTDDTNAIKAAIAAALGQGTRNSTVYFPAGTYLVSDTLTQAEFGTTPTTMTANISGGCITSVTITNGGAGFRATWAGGASRGIYVYGGNGSGANLTASGGTSITSVSVPGGCSGAGYTVAPTVKGVNWRGYLQIHGHNQQDTIIKLANSTAGFTDANCSLSPTEGASRANCRAILYSGSEAEPNQYGSGENAYNNDIWDLTIDTGTGNAGAVGIDWIASNKGSLQNVTVKGSAGRAGINLSRNWNGSGGGPALLRSVTVQGMDYGIYRDGNATEVGYTAYNVNVSGQAVAGVFNRNLGFWIENLTSVNSVPAVVNRDNGNMAIVDGVLTGGSSSNAAILNQGASVVGKLWVRNITTSGYVAGIRAGIGTTNSSGSDVTGTNVSEYSSATPVNLWSTSPSVSLGLPVEDTPEEYVDNDFSHWAIVTASGGDDTTAIQAAMNSGKPVVFFPSYNYKVSATTSISIPSGVRKIFGRGLPMFDTYSGGTSSINPFVCNATTGGSVMIQNIQVNKDLFTLGGIQHNCTVPLIITGFRGDSVNQTAGGTGKLYVEDWALSRYLNLVNSSSTWVRMNNIESGAACMMCVSGGHHLWALGTKTEQVNNPKIASVTGTSYTELIGIFDSVHQTYAGPAYYVVDSQFSMAAMTAYATFSTVVSETRAGVTRTLPFNNGWAGGGTTALPLFTAY